MTDKKNADAQKGVDPKLPAFVKAAPELIPLWDWWVKEGRSTIIMLAVAALAVAGFYGVRHWMRSRDAAANAAFVNAFNTDELETAVQSYGSSKVGYALKLRLAKSYYDAARYEDALKTYDELVKKEDPAFGDIAQIGRAYALEGMAKYDEAGKVFSDYAADASKANSYLHMTAQLGAARCKALNGDKDGAVAELDEIKKNAQSEMDKMRIEEMSGVIKRCDPSRIVRSSFDEANALAAAVEAEQTPAAAKPAVPAAKPAVPAAAKPAVPAAKPAVPAAAKPAVPAAKPAVPAAAKPAAK